MAVQGVGLGNSLHRVLGGLSLIHQRERGRRLRGVLQLLY